MMPITYPDSHEFENAIGILDPGVSCEINFQLWWNIKDGETLLKAGTPMVHLIPLSPELYDVVCRDMTEHDKTWINKRKYLQHFSFRPKRNLIKEFYYNRNIEPPILHEVIDNLTKEFTIDFLRPDNKIFIKNIQSNLTADFKIYNGQSGNLIYETTMNLTSGVDYFIWIGSPKFLDIEGFKKFRVEVVVNNNIIHNEFIHI
jgi:hypothetical protein